MGAVIGKNGSQLKDLGSRTQAYFKVIVDENNDQVVAIHGTASEVAEGERLLQQLFRSLQTTGGCQLPQPSIFLQTA